MQQNDFMLNMAYMSSAPTTKLGYGTRGWVEYHTIKTDTIYIMNAFCFPNIFFTNLSAGSSALY